MDETTAARPVGQARLSATDAAFTGFRLIAREPATFAIWVGLVVALWVGLTAATLALFGGSLVEMQSLSAQSEADPAAALRVFGRLTPLFLLGTAGVLAFYAVAYAAVNRAVLRPAEGGFAHLGFGGDELRQAGLMLLLFLVAVAAALVVGTMVATVRAAAGLTGPSVLLVLVLAAGAVFVGVRLCLASPLTFEGRRIALWRSWPLTDGRFWPLLGALLLAAVVMILVQVVAAIVFAVVALVLGGGLAGAGAIFSDRPPTLAAFLTPTQIAGSIFSAALTTLQIVVFLAVPAGALAQIRAAEAGAPPSPTAPAVPPTRGF